MAGVTIRLGVVVEEKEEGEGEGSGGGTRKGEVRTRQGDSGQEGSGRGRTWRSPLFMISTLPMESRCSSSPRTM